MENTLTVLLAGRDICRKRRRFEPGGSRFESQPKSARFYAIFEKKARVKTYLVSTGLLFTANFGMRNYPSRAQLQSSDHLANLVLDNSLDNFPAVFFTSREGFRKMYCL
jgi:hypothetical protein